jgi:hypothetical protein
MKKVKNSSPAILLIILVLFQFSCGQNVKEASDSTKIKNTLKSVSLFQDTIGLDAALLFAELDAINKVIDEIGYPDAGYKMWEVISDDNLEFRFMVEGYWPDKKTYDLIHENELYKEATSKEEGTWTNLSNTWYYRFNRIKN